MSVAGDYTQAPACIMLATACACCGRPLLDAASVESGVGPECRKKHGYSALPEAARIACNGAIHRLALQASGDAPAGYNAATDLTLLLEQGATKLAERCAKRMTAITIREGEGDQAGKLLVKAPYREELSSAWYAVPGCKWDGTKGVKAHTCPLNSRPQLWAFLQKHFAGSLALGPRGAFVIKKAKPAAPAPAVSPPAALADAPPSLGFPSARQVDQLMEPFLNMRPERLVQRIAAKTLRDACGPEAMRQDVLDAQEARDTLEQQRLDREDARLAAESEVGQ